MSNNNIIVLKSDIKTEQARKALAPTFDQHPLIESWSVDLEDCDKVLRIVAKPEVSELDFIALLIRLGVSADKLTD